MQMLDIPCMVVHNNECYHSWDLVQLDGHWYHTDIYSDAGNGNHTHFNRTDTMQQMDQNWDKDFFPKADSEENCYAVKNAVVQKDVFKIPAEIRKALDENKAAYLAFRIPKEADNRSALVLENLMNRIQERISYYSSECSSGDISWQWLPLEKEYVISIVINQYNNSEPDPNTLPEEDLNRIDNIMEEIFGDYDNFCGDPSEPKG